MLHATADHGRTFAFEPARTALLMIDMQRDFLDPDGASGVAGEDLAPLRAILPACQRLLAWAREAGLFVVHTREGHSADLADLPAPKRLRSREAGAEIGQPGPLGRFLVRGEAGHDFVSELYPLPNESVVDKPGFSPFHATDLGHRLRLKGVTHTLVAGVTTQCCVFGAVRDAVDHGLFTCLVRDATAAFDPRLHRATLDIIESEGHLFGWTSTTEALVAAAGK